MSNKLSIVFYVNGMPFNGDTLKEKSLGGSETAGLCMAREMAKRGHDVTMFCNIDKSNKYDGVKYHPIEMFTPYVAITQVDAIIGQRIPEIFGQQYKSKINILWQHDIALKRNRGNFINALWNIDEVWGVSDYHIKQMIDINNTKEAFKATRNGIDWVELGDVERNPKRLIYTARPERGMDNLLNIMPKVWAKDPDIELHIAGYDNTVPQMKDFYQGLFNKIAEFEAQGYKIKHLGALTKEELYKEYQEASLYVYPTEFEEVSCITAMECMMTGLPFLGSKVGALPETLSKDASCLIQGDAKSEAYQKKFVEKIFKILKDKKLHTHMSEKGVEFARELTWEGLAEEWEARLYELFEAKTQNIKTLAKHYYRNEDIMALKALDDPEWNKVIDAEYPFINNKEAYKEIYDKQGKHFKDVAKNINLVPYQRVQLAIDTLKDCSNILDYAGGYGNEAMQMVNSLDCKVTTVNISKDEQDLGQSIVNKACNKPENITWKVASDPTEIEGKFDGAFCGEILEHLEDPLKFVNDIEKRVKKDGTIVLTVPLGSWGDVSDINAYRGHLWSFEQQDLKDLFGDKDDIIITAISGGINPENGEMLGWYAVSYKNTGKPTGTINMDRKLKQQAPRETISACMIIGGQQEGLLHRCLTSMYPFVDEIIVCDTGMTKEARDICECKKYSKKLRIIDNAPNPLEVGFDEARNFSIKEAKMDWVLWLDSDEELHGGTNLYKYLRKNPYNAYAIPQHHFNLNDTTKVDMPARLFRNNRGITFLGVVHEHPREGKSEMIENVYGLHDMQIAHDGYHTEAVRRERFARNIELMKLDREKNPNRMLGKFLWIRDCIHQARYSLEQTNGQLTHEVIACCEEAIKLFKKDFLDKDNVHSQDGVMYYSEALKILGRGKDYLFNIEVNSEGITEPPKYGRFENNEEFGKFFMACVNNKSEPFEGKYA